MDPVELTRWLDALAELGFIKEWRWGLDNEPGQLTEARYLIDGRPNSYNGAVKLVRDFEATSLPSIG